MVGCISSSYDPLSVLIASIHTFTVFSAITLYSFQPNPAYDLTLFGNTLLASITALTIGAIMNIFFQIPFVDNVMTGLSAIVFAMYILHDTQLIVGNKHHKRKFNPDDYILAALSLYQDVIVLFIKILRIIGKDSKEKK